MKRIAAQAQPTLPTRAAFPVRAANLAPTPEPRPAAPAAAAPLPPPRPPFAYAGKLAEGNQIRRST